VAPRNWGGPLPERALSRLGAALRKYVDAGPDPEFFAPLDKLKDASFLSALELEAALDDISQMLESRSERHDSSSRIMGTLVESLADIRGILPIAQNVFRVVPAKTEEATSELISRFEAVEAASSHAASAASRILDKLGGGKTGGDSIQAVAKSTRRAIETERGAIDLIVSHNKMNAAKLQEMGKELESGIGIVNEINEINERSRLIAFNMAVEAARLGEGGRGIRVIVNELRSLNDRTTKFASEIVGLLKRFRDYNQALVNEITNSSEKLNGEVVAGMQTTNEAVESLIASASTTEELSSQIASASVEVQKNLDKVLEALQFQDISRQILEGGLSILQRARSLVAGTEALGGDLGDGQAARERLEVYKREFTAQAKTKDEKIAISEEIT
jgi:methyl-accepting chemotaxis protein